MGDMPAETWLEGLLITQTAHKQMVVDTEQPPCSIWLISPLGNPVRFGTLSAASRDFFIWSQMSLSLRVNVKLLHWRDSMSVPSVNLESSYW